MTSSPKKIAKTNRNKFPTSSSGRDPLPSRNLHFSSRDNSEFKWKHDKTVVGALEIPAEPVLKLHAAEYKRHSIVGYEDELEHCLKLWKEWKLQKEFIQAFEALPVQSKCCGLIEDMDGTIQHHVPLLNHGWVKQVNDEKFSKEGYRMSMFVWSWSNPTGKSQTVIPMIRFHSLHIKRGE
jgi:hypothetical protein